MQPWLLLSSVASVTRDHEQQCGTYTLVELHLPWADAQAYCQSRGGALAAVRSVFGWQAMAGCKGRMTQGHNRHMDEIWLGGFREHGTQSVWRWATDDQEVFWRNGSTGGFHCWNSLSPSQRNVLALPDVDTRHLSLPVADAATSLCLRAMLPLSHPTASDRRGFFVTRRFSGLEHCWGGSWWAESCERRLMFLCEGGDWPPVLPPPPAPPPEPPLPPTPPFSPPVPPYSPAFAYPRCCLRYYRWAPPCCACNHYCRDTLVAALALGVLLGLPICFYIHLHRRQQRRRLLTSSAASDVPAGVLMTNTSDSSRGELTAWPRLPVGPLQRACFQCGLLLALLGMLPSALWTVRHARPTHAPRSSVAPPFRLQSHGARIAANLLLRGTLLLLSPFPLRRSPLSPSPLPPLSHSYSLPGSGPSMAHIGQCLSA